MEQVRVGSTRIMKPVEPGIISVLYTNGWSVFDRVTSAQTIPGIGEARCRAAVKSFWLADEAGIETHFVKQVSPTTIHVRECTIPGRESLSGKVWGRVLDAEWIWRARVAGSLLERIKLWESDKVSGIDPFTLGFFPHDVVEWGTKLPRLMQECTTKFESVDRHLTQRETLERIGVSEAQYKEIWEMISRAVEASNACYEKAGFYSFDGKLEIAQRESGGFMIVDVFGNPDENRLAKQSSGELYCKDLIRDYLKSLPWKAELDAAKQQYPNDKSKWPEYPLLPEELVAQVAARYQEVSWQYMEA